MTWLMEFESTSFTGEKIKTPDFKPSPDICSCDEDGFGPCPHCKRKKGKAAQRNLGLFEKPDA